MLLLRDLICGSAQLFGCFLVTQQNSCCPALHFLSASISGDLELHQGEYESFLAVCVPRQGFRLLPEHSPGIISRNTCPCSWPCTARASRARSKLPYFLMPLQMLGTSSRVSFPLFLLWSSAL